MQKRQSLCLFYYVEYYIKGYKNAHFMNTGTSILSATRYRVAHVLRFSFTLNTFVISKLLAYFLQFLKFYHIEQIYSDYA